MLGEYQPVILTVQNKHSDVCTDSKLGEPKVDMNSPLVPRFQELIYYAIEIIEKSPPIIVFKSTL